MESEDSNDYDIVYDLFEPLKVEDKEGFYTVKYFSSYYGNFELKIAYMTYIQLLKLIVNSNTDLYECNVSYICENQNSQLGKLTFGYHERTDQVEYCIDNLTEDFIKKIEFDVNKILESEDDEFTPIKIKVIRY